MHAIYSVRAALTAELQSADEIGSRCELSRAAVAAALRELRRAGEAEFVELDDAFRWRLTPRPGVASGRGTNPAAADEPRRQN